MAIYKEDIVDVELQSGTIFRSFLNSTLGEADNKANRFGVRLFRNGEQANVEDSSICGLFMAPSGTNFLITETTYPGSTGISGNVAYVTIPEDCYAVEGQFSLAIKLVGEGVTGTMRIVDGTISRTGAAGAVAPTSSIPTSEEIIAAYEEALELIDGVVRHDVAQSLTSSEKEQARSNIDAVSQDELEAEAERTDALIYEADRSIDALIYEADSVLIYNLTGEKQWTAGNYIRNDTGAVGYANDYSAILDYIPVKKSSVYSVSRNGGATYALYNSSKEYTSGGAWASSGDNTNTITTGANDAYIRVSCMTAEISKFGLYEGYSASAGIRKGSYIPEVLGVKSIAVNPSNYASVLPDVNDIFENISYKMYFSNGSGNIPAHMPFDRWISDGCAVLITFGVYGNDGKAGAQQILIGKTFIFAREYASEWKDWVAYKLELNVGTGYGVVSDFSSLTDAILLATKYRNAVVNVYNGTFDLFTEFKNHYGSDFFDNYTATTSPRGIHLKNNVHIKCGSNAKIVFNYTGSNVHVRQQFSPFNFLNDCVDGFTLENADVECSNCRYVVHDDPSDTSRAYHNRYINCKFKIDNSGNSDWAYESVIGGGLGRAGAVTIDGCYLEAKEFMTGTGDAVHRVLSYHNDVSTNEAVNSVEIKNNYIANHGKIVVYYGGTSQEDSSVVIICGNSMGGEISEESASSGTIHNMKIIDWNNEIRSN